MAFAEERFKLEEPVEGKSETPLRAHLEQAAKSLGVDPDTFLEEQGFTQKDPPCELEHLFSIFQDLHYARKSNGFDLDSISYADIETWGRVHRVDLLPWEYDTLRSLDAAWRKVRNARPGRT